MSALEQHTVSANGAMKLRSPWTMFLAWSLTISTIISTKAWKRPGTPEVARRAAALGMHVLATRNSSREGPPFVEDVGLSDEYVQLAARADVVVNSTPLTPRTVGMFDAKFFAVMKETALFINIGRGESVVTADLTAALAEGRIGGAGLDVTEPEPLPEGHPLWSMPNVILTPHDASTSRGNTARADAIFLEELERWQRGELPSRSVQER